MYAPINKDDVDTPVVINPVIMLSYSPSAFGNLGKSHKIPAASDNDHYIPTSIAYLTKHAHGTISIPTHRRSYSIDAIQD